MSNRLMVNSSILLLLAALMTQGLAQSGRNRGRTVGTNQGDRDSVRLRVEEVLLPVSVRSDFGSLTAPLKRSDLIVTEDGQRRQVNDVIRTAANVLFIIDASGERTIKELNSHRDLALSIVAMLGENDRAAIVTYSDTVNVLSPWTSNKSELKHALKTRFKPGLSSRFYDCLLYASDEMLSRVQGRRSVVVIGDGIETVNPQAFEKALAALHRARAILYAAGQNEILLGSIRPAAFNSLSWYEMLDPRGRRRVEALRAYYHQVEAGEVTLKGLAEETGGASWMPSTADEFKSLPGLIAREIANEYVVAYSSERTADDAEFHSVKIYATQPGIIVRSRRGIYSDPNQQQAFGERKPARSAYR